MHAEAQMNLEALRRSADSACRLMKVLSNPDRLLLLCQLTQGEKRVGELEELVGTPSPPCPNSWAYCARRASSTPAAKAKTSITRSPAPRPWR